MRKGEVSLASVAILKTKSPGIARLRPRSSSSIMFCLNRSVRRRVVAVFCHSAADGGAADELDFVEFAVQLAALVRRSSGAYNHQYKPTIFSFTQPKFTLPSVTATGSALSMIPLHVPSLVVTPTGVTVALPPGCCFRRALGRGRSGWGRGGRSRAVSASAYLVPAADRSGR